MSKYWNKKWAMDTLDRVVATVAQTAVATISANATGLLDVDFAQVASVAGLSGALALLTAIAFRGGAKKIDNK